MTDNQTTAPLVYAEPSTERGAVTWHSSGPDEGPDVGLSLGLGNDRLLWVGELPDRDGWGLAIYHEVKDGERTDFGTFDDAESARQFFDIMERVVNGE